MSAAVNKTLLALVLALKDVQDLSEDEKDAFKDAADQLQLDPDNWEDYEDYLLTVVLANSDLNQRYQFAKSQLDALNGEIPSDLLPTPAELAAAIPTNQIPVTRGKLPVNDRYKSNEINNLAINVFSTANPPETAKKLSIIEKIQQFLQQSLKSK
ncbi:hypothetical protein MiSe_02150 [Microseira wollei NIES-4236]|uniref:TerB-C domain-containing protein n=2 Tax=Microseira wollei TaxID=467598 RepID=A0AAV3X2H7_9CYAN|nr:hypothetical protein MiSe_02150 [Microseira wollei NIES-4236]